jgi:hypothetical protein
MVKMLKTVTPAAVSASILAFCLCTSAQAQARAQDRAKTESAQAQPAQPAKAKSSQTQPAKAKPARTEPQKSTADDRQTVEVTIYNNDLGLVKEQRAVRIAAGEGELQFIDVPSQINPVTVHIKPLGGSADFAVLEQNYEYDLISHAKLMDKYVGRTIKIMTSNEYQDRKDVVSAELLSASSGEVYKIDGEIYLGHPGIKILPELPGNLISRPTLSWIYRSKDGGDRQLEVSYMTSGMGWNADYILVSGEGKTGSALSGWVTVNNRSGAEFEDAKLKLMAGNVNRVRPEPANFPADRRMRGAAVMEMAAAPAFEQAELFEYYMYDLQRPTTLKNNQTKQISLMEAQGLAVAKEYTTTAGFVGVRHSSEPGQPVKQPVNVFLTFKNAKENKLGDPLPAGVIRIYTADGQGRLQFVGEDRIQHTPKDETVRLRTGEAFDIVVERSQTDFQQKTSRQTETAWEVAIRNRKDEDVTVGVIERAHGTWEVRESSHKHVKVDATTLRFDVAVGKGQEVKVKYKIRVDN